MTTDSEATAINAALAAELERVAKNTTELKADITQTIQTALAAAMDYGEEDHMGNYSRRRPKALNIEVVDGALLVEWSEGGRTERFALEVTRA